MRKAVFEHGAAREVRGHLLEEGHQNRLATHIRQLVISLYNLGKVCIVAFPASKNGH